MLFVAHKSHFCAGAAGVCSLRLTGHIRTGHIDATASVESDPLEPDGPFQATSPATASGPTTRLFALLFG